MIATLREKNEECFTADVYEGGQVTRGFPEREANTSAGDGKHGERAVNLQESSAVDVNERPRDVEDTWV